MFCPKCGKENDDTNFCAHCGNRLPGAAENKPATERHETELEGKSELTAPKPRWFVSILPFLGWLAWLSLGFRTRKASHFIAAVIYAIPLLLFGAVFLVTGGDVPKAIGVPMLLEIVLWAVRIGHTFRGGLARGQQRSVENFKEAGKVLGTVALGVAAGYAAGKAIDKTWDSVVRGKK